MMPWFFSVWKREGRVWIVHKISSAGQVFLRPHADTNKKGKFWAPTARTFAEKGAKKIAVDPIGRIHPANDCIILL